MLDFLKRFGLGILYIVISPFVLVYLACRALFALIVIFVEFFKCCKSFFQGKKFLAELPEDEKANQILLTLNQQQISASPSEQVENSVSAQNKENEVKNNVDESAVDTNKEEINNE